MVFPRNPAGSADYTQIHRFWDPRYNIRAVKIGPGGWYVTGDNEMLVTTLGSCVSACVRDPDTGVGGMNHFLLPGNDGEAWGGESRSFRYGVNAMESLINMVLASGCPRGRLEIKLFGGADMAYKINRVGRRNAQFAVSYFEREGLPVAARDLGGDRPRRIHYFPADGRVNRLLLGTSMAMAVVDEEQRYRESLRAKPPETEVELF